MKNKKLIVGLLACLLAVSVPFMARQPNKVNADNISTSSPVILLPSSIIPRPNNAQIVIPNFYYGVNGEGIQGIYALRGVTTSEFEYVFYGFDKGRLTLSNLDGYYVNSSGVTRFDSIKDPNLSTISFQFFTPPNSSFTGYDFFNYILNNATTLDCVLIYDIAPVDSGTRLQYNFKNSSNEIVLSLELIGLKTSTSSAIVQNNYSNLTIIYTDTTEYFEELINSSFDTGYGKGYETGYDAGFRDATGEKGLFGVFATSISQLLNIEIVPNIRLGYMITISFGIILFGLVIKVFLGG